MGQIVFNGQKPKYCNLTAITTGSKKDYLIPDGEIWLIDSTNTSKTDGTGKYDYYIKGDGSNTASQLAANKIKVDDSIDISGKADKSEMSVVAGTGANADKTTITLKSGTSATVLTQHQDVSGKEDKSNKVTSFSSPTDTQYPSAKLVSDQLATKQDTISDLSTIRSGAAAGATAIQSVTVGTTTTGAAGSSASVTNTGTATEPVLSFTIPQGEQGVKGDTVIMGDENSYTLYNVTGDAVDGAMTQQAVTRELTELGGKVDELDQEVNGVDLTLYSGLLKSDGTIASPLSGQTYRVWRVQGGDTIRYFGSVSIQFYVASDFTYNPTLPYTIVLATGETGPHTAADAATIYEITLPEDAKYIVINVIDPSVVTFEINGKSAFVPVTDYEVTTREELNRRIWILVGQGSWQTIGKNDWKVGDRFYLYSSANEIGQIVEVTEISGGGTGVQRFRPIYNVVTNGGLFIIDGHFYTYKGGENLVRLADIQDILTLIGSLSSLDTTSQTSIVAAVNEVLSYVGDISSLTTSAKTSVVSAINELVNKFIETISTSQSVRENKYWNTKPNGAAITVGDTWTGNSSNLNGYHSSEAISVQAGETYKYYGIGSNNAAFKSYVIVDSSDKVLVISSLANNSNYRTTPFDIVIPSNGAKLYVNFGSNYDSTTDKLVKYTEQEIDLVQMQEDIDDLKLDVDGLKKLPLYGKTIVCFGDSITEFHPTGGKTYSEYLAEFSGATVINVGVGGTRLAQRTTPVTTPTTNLEAMAACDIVNMVKAACEQDFTKQVNAMQWEYDNNHYDKRDIITRLQGIDWSAVDMVIILGGTNDWQSTHTFGTTGYTDFDVNTTIGAMNYMLRLLTYTYPHLSVYFGVGTYQYKDDDFEKAFSASATFEIGEDTIYKGRLYKFTSAHSSGTWNTSEVRLLTDTELYNLSSDVVEFGSKTKREFNELLLAEAKSSSVSVLDLYNNIWNAYNYTTALMADLTHPLNGNDKLGKWVLSQIMKNYKTI